MTLKRFFVHLLLMALLILFVFGGVLLWLRFYTNHGQKIEVKDYIGIDYKQAAKHAQKQSFELIVKDSVHRVGQPGGVIIAQNPKGGSEVKENRQLYVDITKYNPDVYDLNELPEMYGSPYSAMVSTLESLQIQSVVSSKRYDSGAPGHILEVRYNGALIVGASGRKKGVKIEKGGTLEFVISKKEGAAVPIPKLVCMQYSSVGFVLKGYQLSLGAIETSGAITERASAWVIAQNPPYQEGRMINTNESIEVTIQQTKPESCL